MSKIQKIVRKNGSEIFSVNIPQEIIEKTNWKKGDEVFFYISYEQDNKLIVILKTIEI